MTLLLWLLACDGSTPDAPSLSPEQAEAQAEALLDKKTQPPDDPPAAASATSASAPSSGEPLPVVLVWEGISALHRGFFSDPEATQKLQQDLSGTLEAPADLYVRFNSQEMIGDLRIQLRPNQLQKKPTVDGNVIDLQALAPITTALASYRSDIAARFDFRIESFRVGLESYRGSRVCIFGLAGKPPPDGRLISPCVEISGQKQCGVPSDDGVRFSAKAARDIRACLDI